MVIALILSGGIGSRIESDIPKQYIKVASKPIISYSLDMIQDCSRIDYIQIVAEPEWVDYINSNVCIKTASNIKLKGFSPPGKTRQLSIYNGISDIKEYASDDDIVFIHDAARPMLTEKMVEYYVNAVKDHDGLIPVLPMKDTVYRSFHGDRIDELLNRSEIYAGQAPELFVLGKYYEANKRLLPDEILKINGSSEPAVMAGMDVVMVPGDESNFKITTPADLERFKELVEGKQSNKG